MNFKNILFIMLAANVFAMEHGGGKKAESLFKKGKNFASTGHGVSIFKAQAGKGQSMFQQHSLLGKSKSMFTERNAKSMFNDAGGSKNEGSVFDNTALGKTNSMLERTHCACEKQEPLSQMMWIFSDVAPRMYKRSVKPMGVGAQAAIYHGYSFPTKRCVAIKISDFKLTDVPENIKKKAAKKENELLQDLAKKKLSHILQMEYSHYSQEENTLTLIMELGDISLETYWINFVKANRGDEDKLVNEMTYILKDVLWAFYQLHDIAHMVHLDFKPQNVLLFKNKNYPKGYHLKLIDFGASEKMDKNVITNWGGEFLLFRTMVPQQVCCSVQYYAPEQRIHYYYDAFSQHEENVVSIKTDVWAIGNFIIWMLTTIKKIPNTPELEHANDVFFRMREPWFVEMDENENNYRTVRAKMRTFYEFSNQLKTDKNAALIYMAQACLHADPRLRAKVKMLLDFMDNKEKLHVSSQYNLDPNIKEDGKFYRDFQPKRLKN